ncbi:MAG TPA: 50S ribosomal protein L25 [Patescibacteria group bacterium]|nr:50S ribosomal protein L25 [Patescibacteria group bacterium]
MTFNLITGRREKGTAEEVRTMGKIPGVLYGSGIETVSLAVDRLAFERLYGQAGESNLIDLVWEGEKGEPVKVLIQDLQYDPIKKNIIHFDLRQIKMDEEMTANIPLRFVGEPPAVKELGGTFETGLDEVEVKCLPRDLVGEISVDISKLATFADMIYVKDLPVPAGITIMANPDTLIAKVAAPLTEEQLKAMEESTPTSVEDVEVEKKGKEEVPAEGEQPAAEAKKE